MFLNREIQQNCWGVNLVSCYDILARSVSVVKCARCCHAGLLTRDQVRFPRGEGWLAEVVFFFWSGTRDPESAPAFPLDLLSYLRTSILECGGFPGLFGHLKFERIREKLVAGLPLF